VFVSEDSLRQGANIRSVRRRKVDKKREAKRKEAGEAEAELSEDDDANVVEKHRFAIDVLNVGFTIVEGVANVHKVELDEKLPPKWNIKKE
jgi:hypothetical protein